MGSVLLLLVAILSPVLLAVRVGPGTAAHLRAMGSVLEGIRGPEERPLDVGGCDVAADAVVAFFDRSCQGGSRYFSLWIRQVQ